MVLGILGKYYIQVHFVVSSALHSCVCVPMCIQLNNNSVCEKKTLCNLGAVVCSDEAEEEEEERKN